MKNQDTRELTVHETSGYKYKGTPTIMLKGQWLEKYGFSIGTKVDVRCEDKKIIITPVKAQ